MQPTLPPIGFYEHYKHDPNGPEHSYVYEVTGYARNTEDKSFAVLYRPLYENDWFAPATAQARPLEMFMEDVEKDGVRIPRFTLITDPERIAVLIQARERLYGV